MASGARGCPMPGSMNRRPRLIVSRLLPAVLVTFASVVPLAGQEPKEAKGPAKAPAKAPPT